MHLIHEIFHKIKIKVLSLPKSILVKLWSKPGNNRHLQLTRKKIKQIKLHFIIKYILVELEVHIYIWIDSKKVLLCRYAANVFIYITQWNITISDLGDREQSCALHSTTFDLRISYTQWAVSWWDSGTGEKTRGSK